MSLLKLLSNYLPENSAERENKIKMLNFLANEPNCFERDCLKGHFTGSCWIENFCGDSILLMHHRKYGDWLQLGGHADGDDDLLRVSLKEAYEESGLSVEPVNGDIFDIGVHLVPSYKDVPEHYHYDVRFYLKATKDGPYVINEESYNLRWVKFDEEDSLPNERDIKRMFRKWKALKAFPVFH
ncbi:MAG: NUDIX hydrolase [Holosporales bacterium]|jgi:8-oxo-dGTP pyrophosphatase MutT (NUDIX family)|nr:NUDIX hydrolase [Holosporales bacterium]